MNVKIIYKDPSWKGSTKIKLSPKSRLLGLAQISLTRLFLRCNTPNND